MIANSGQRVVDLGERREQRKLDFTRASRGQFVEQGIGGQIGCPAADGNCHVQFQGLPHGLRQVIRIRYITDDKLDLLDAPCGQPQKNRPQSLRLRQRQMRRARRRHWRFDKSDPLEEI